MINAASSQGHMMKRFVIALLAVALVLTGAQSAFAYLTDSHNVRDTVTIADPRAFATLYENGTLIFTKGQPTYAQQQEYGEGTAVVAQYGGIEDYEGSRPPWFVTNHEDNEQSYNRFESATEAIVIEEISPSKTGYWFAKMPNVKTVDVHNMDSSSITYAEAMFWDCTNLTRVTWNNLSPFLTSKCTDMSSLFHGCEHIGKLNMEALTDITGCVSTSGSPNRMGNMFLDMKRLSEIYLPASWSFDNNGKAEKAAILPTPDPTYIEGADGHWYDEDGNAYTPAELVDMWSPEMAGTYYAVGPTDPYATLYENGSMIFTLGEPTPAEAEQYGGGTAVVGQWTDFADVAYSAREDVPWYDDRREVETITVVEGFAPANMGYWFCSMSNLTAVDLAKLDASRSESFYRLFYGCESLTAFDESDFTGSSAVDVGRMFENCTSLTTINAPKLVTSACQDAGEFAQGCSALTALDVSAWDTSSVETFSRFLKGCSSLEQCDLSGFDTGACSSFSSMMEGCEKLVTPGDLGSWDMQNAESLSAMFYQCDVMTTVGDLSGWQFSDRLDSLRNTFAECYALVDVGDLDNWNVASCTTIRGLFVDCQSLTNIGDISNWEVGNVDSLERTFADCFVLPHIGDLSNWDVSNVDTFKLTFGECQALTSVGDLSGWYAPKATTYDRCFMGCQVLESIGDLSNWPMDNVVSTASMFERCLKVTTLGDLSGWVMPLNESYESMFAECYALRTIGDISGWDTSASTTFQDFMYACYNLDGIGDLGGWDMSSVTTVQRMFYSAQKLASLGDLSGWQVGNVQSFRLAFGNLYSLSTLGDLSAWDTHSATTLYGMFDQSDKITSLGDLGGWDVSHVENFRGMFGGMESLQEVGDLSAWNTAAGTNFYGMFHDTALSKLDLSGWDTRNATDLTDMFNGMDYLREITLGANFSFDGNGTIDGAKHAYLPTPSSQYIEGADGYWYAKSNNAAYDNDSIPDDTADTYYAVNPIEEGPAYATLYANGTMIFTTNAPTAEQAQQYGGSADAQVLGQWSGFDSSLSGTKANQVWSSFASKVQRVIAVESISPHSTAFWFSGMTNLSFVDLALLDGSLVVYADWMFQQCASLIEVDLSQFVTPNLASATDVFSGCSKLIAIDLSGFDTQNCSSINLLDMFYKCSSLSEITIGATATYQQQLSGTGFYTWYGEDGAAYAPADIPQGTAGTYFSSDPTLAYATLYANGTMIFTMGEPAIEQAEQYGGSAYAQVLGQWSGFEDDAAYTSGSQVPWFSQCTNVNKVVVAESIKPSQTAMWFYGMSNLTDVDLDLLDTSSVTDFGGMFFGCSALTYLSLPESFNTSSATDIGSLFSGCSSLVKLTLPETFNTSKVTYMLQVFYSCSSLKELVLPEAFDTSNATIFAWMFNECTSLERITIGNKFGHTSLLPTDDWWDVSTGEKFTRSTMSNRAGTYVNSQSLLP